MLKNKLSKNRKGFALIYVLAIMVISGMAVVTLTMGMVSIIRLNRQTEASIQSYNLAYTGIEHGLRDYNNGSGSTSPTNGCSATSPDSFNRVDPTSSATIATPTQVDQYKSPTATLQYDYRLCVGTDKYIESVGYFKGYKIKLWADISTVSGTSVKIRQE